MLNVLNIVMYMLLKYDTMHNNNNSHSILPSSQFHNFTCYISVKIRRWQLVNKYDCINIHNII